MRDRLGRACDLASPRLYDGPGWLVAARGAGTLCGGVSGRHVGRLQVAAVLAETSNMVGSPYPRSVRPSSFSWDGHTFRGGGALPYAILPSMITATQHPHERSAEYTLILAIIHQAQQDLRAQAPAQERAASRQFFRNDEGYLELLCDLVDLEYAPVQDTVMRQYPDVF